MNGPWLTLKYMADFRIHQLDYINHCLSQSLPRRMMILKAHIYGFSKIGQSDWLYNSTLSLFIDFPKIHTMIGMVRITKYDDMFVDSYDFWLESFVPWLQFRESHVCTRVYVAYSEAREAKLCPSLSSWSAAELVINRSLQQEQSAYSIITGRRITW